MPQSDFWAFGKCPTTECGDDANLLQKQLGDMEGEVKEIQMELAAIKKDRLDLVSRKNVRGPIIFQTDPAIKEIEGAHNGQMDERHRLTEISELREELSKAKSIADDERIKREKYESKLADLEVKLNNLCSLGINNEKEQRKVSDEVVSALKIQIRDFKEETEELKLTLSEKSEQLQEYRVKYLHAQQQVEELKRQLDIIEFDNKQVSDQIHIEIQKMKMQFQEKLQELAPLPDLLNGAQMQLQEAKQLQSLAEDSSQQLSNELRRVKEKLVAAVSNLNQEKGENVKLLEENKLLSATVEEKSKEIEELLKNADEFKCTITRLEEKMINQDALFREKCAENTQLSKEFEEIREENSRSLARCKERAESMRRFMQAQVSELERQLVQTRAQCRAFQKERDDIRQRMQIQLNSLQENFELVELRLRTLQGQVSSLKNSYTVILADEDISTEFTKNIVTNIE